jgi:hypothetical protein
MEPRPGRVEYGKPVPIKQVALLPLGRGSMESTLLARMNMPGMNYWLVFARADSPRRCLAHAIACALLDNASQILTPALFPPRPPVALFSWNGNARSGRNRLLPEWALREIERIATQLESDGEYIGRAYAVLRGEAAEGFQSPDPESEIFKGLPGLTLGLLPTGIAPDVSHRPSTNIFTNQASEYPRNRYLRHLSGAALAQRRDDIIGAICSVNNIGQISLDSQDPQCFSLLGLLQDVVLELQVRGSDWRQNATLHPLRKSDLPISLSKAKLHSPLTLSTKARVPEWALVRYDKLSHLQDALYHGRIRLKPATSFLDPSLDPSRHADEQNATIWYSPADYERDLPLSQIAPRPMVQTVNSDYYVLCMSERLNLRLLRDFEAEGALVVHDPAAFTQRIERAASALLKGWRQVSGPASYFDPLQVTPQELQLPLSKHFRYCYQAESRFAWLPPTRHEKLAPIFLELGNLEDIAEIVRPTPTD